MKRVNGIIIKIYNRLISIRIINSNNAVFRRIRAALFHNICYRCSAYMGSNNQDRKFYVIRCPQENMGLFAVINYVVYHLKIAEKEGLDPVIDWQYYPNKYFSEDEHVGKVNVWDKFFDQPSGITIDEVYRSRNVELSSGDWDAAALQEIYNSDELAESHRVYRKFIHLNERMKSIVEEERKRIGFEKQRVLAVKIRGTDFVTARPSDHSTVLSAESTTELVDAKRQEWGDFDRIYLATEDADALRAMIDKYGTMVCYTSGKTYDKVDVGNRWLSEMYDKGCIDKISDMETYLVTTYMMAEADYLIAPAVGGTLGAMRIKGQYKELCIV